MSIEKTIRNEVVSTRKSPFDNMFDYFGSKERSSRLDCNF